MTLVNAETGEIVEFDRAAAERRAQQIEARLSAIGESFTAAMQKIREAIEHRDDIALGYRSPGDYISARFGRALSGLPVEMRREAVRELTEAGMSTRAIAPIVDVTRQMVSKDRAALAGGNRVATSQTPEPAAEGEAETGSGQTPERGKGEPVAGSPTSPPLDGRPAPTPSPAPVVGIDGKTYSRPTPRPKPVVNEDEWSEQDRAEELAGNLARNLSLLYAVTNPERRADYIATWRLGTRSRPVLGQNFITPTHMRRLADALRDFADEWEQAHG